MKKLALLVMAILMVNLAAGLGVGPVKKHIIYNPNTAETVELTIINNDHKEMKVAIYAKGELEEFITIDRPLLIIKENEEFTKMTYRFTMPQELKPGTITTDIYILELPSEFETVQQTLVKATTAVVSQLELEVPYPGKYAEAKLNIDSSGIPVQFSMPIYNFGKEKIMNATAKIDIFGATYEKVGSAISTSISLEPQKEGKLLAAWMPDVNPGTYLAIATIDYDGKKIRLEQSFSVSNLMLKINDISTREFRLGEIAVFNIEIESMWNEQVDDVYGEMTIIYKGTELTRFKTASVSVKPMSKEMLYGYWDTKGIDEGVYDIEFTLFFAGKTVKKSAEIIVSFNGISVATPTAQAVSGKPGLMSRENILTVLVIILIIIVIVLIILNLKWLKRRPPPPRSI